MSNEFDDYRKAWGLDDTFAEVPPGVTAPPPLHGAWEIMPDGSKKSILYRDTHSGMTGGVLDKWREDQSFKFMTPEKWANPETIDTLEMLGEFIEDRLAPIGLTRSSDRQRAHELTEALADQVARIAKGIRHKNPSLWEVPERQRRDQPGEDYLKDLRQWIRMGLDPSHHPITADGEEYVRPRRVAAAGSGVRLKPNGGRKRGRPKLDAAEEAFQHDVLDGWNRAKGTKSRQEYVDDWNETHDGHITVKDLENYQGWLRERVRRAGNHRTKLLRQQPI